VIEEYLRLSHAVMPYGELAKRTGDFNRRVRALYGIFEHSLEAESLLLDAEHFFDERMFAIYAPELLQLGITSPRQMLAAAAHALHHRRNSASVGEQAGIELREGKSLTDEKEARIPTEGARTRWPKLHQVLFEFMVFWQGKPDYWRRFGPQLTDLHRRALDLDL
jgi:hypothetical protein